MLRNAFGVLAPAILLFTGFSAISMPSPMDDKLFGAFDYSDVTMLEKIKSETADENVSRLADIMLLTVRHKESEALELYDKLDIRHLPRQLRCAADLNKAMVYERLNHHSLVVDAISDAGHEANCASPFVQDTRSLHASLRDEQTDILAIKAAGKIPLKRDANKLPLASISVNGRIQDALIDTASTFSVISASNAKKLELRAVEGTSQVTTANGHLVAANIAIAPDLQIGNCRFKNVLFVVIPDSKWPDPIDQIIVGMSVLNQLSRLEFDHTDGNDTLVYGHTPGEQVGPSNMIFHWWQPYVMARINSDPEPVRILIDTGADKTIFNQTLLLAHPGVERAAGSVPLGYQGVDGANVDQEALLITNIDLGIGSANVNIKSVPLIKSTGPAYHGLFGQETLLSTKKVVIDFDNMYFSMN